MSDYSFFIKNIYKYKFFINILKFKKKKFDKIAILFPDKIYLKYVYLSKTGKILNLDNPKLFSEKINYLKIKNKHSEKIKLYADKFLLRDQLKKLYLDKYLTKLYLCKNIADFTIDDLKLIQRKHKSFFVKLSNDSGSSLRVTDQTNFKEIYMSIKKSYENKKNFIRKTREYQYLTETKVMFEEDLINKNLKLYDMKLFCFNGQMKLIQIGTNKTGTCYFDENFKILDLYLQASLIGEIDYYYGKKINPVEKDTMNNIKHDILKFTKDFSFIRVDFITDLRLNFYLNEITFSPSSGFKIYQSDTLKNFDKKLGNYIQI